MFNIYHMMSPEKATTSNTPPSEKHHHDAQTPTMSQSEILLLFHTLVKEDPATRIIEDFDESEIEMMTERGFTPVSELVLVDTSRNLEVSKSEKGWVVMEGWTLELYILLGHSADDLMEAMEQDLWKWDWTPFPGVIFQR